MEYALLSRVNSTGQGLPRYHLLELRGTALRHFRFASTGVDYADEIKEIDLRLSDMKVKVKLFGILGQRFPGYQHEQGMDVEIPDGARVKDLLAHLEFSKSFAGVVAVEGELLSADAGLDNGAEVNIFQSAFGG
ncbi:MAG: hypothetical protein JRG79_16075 [Deltaproteobacteria bacterium]|nr:hypothetical protein [Deltaproteobacteria bacterium]